MADLPNDVLGAIASNAGDEFHELWALREALTLLDAKSDLVAVTVEGVVAPSAGANSRQWDGVDCALYYGEQSNVSRIDLVQLKYSVSSSEKNWTLGRITNSTSTRSNNSVARRLANAFKAACADRDSSNQNHSISASLVSNQEIGPRLTSLLESINQGRTDSRDAKKFRSATGLSKTLFKDFCKCLLLKGGESARSILETGVVFQIATVTDAEALGTLNDLRQTVRKRMLPESKDELIDRETVLSWFGVGDPHSLFPCQAELEAVLHPIPRLVVDQLAAAVVSNPFVCFHGGGGCGKTTAAMDLVSKLPPTSRVIVYDCYGGGRYLDPSLSRHRSHEAFTQLSNELAIAFRVPLLIPQQDNPNIASSFRKRLEVAAELLAAQSTNGLLVIVIDAADNSVFAATKLTPPDRCFVQELVEFSDLPDNVRLVFSARTSRLGDLNLPPKLKAVSCGPFELAESAQLLRRKWSDAGSEDVEQFHHLSTHNPRVQASTVARAQTIEEALELLRPNGQSLSALYEKLLTDSALKMGVSDSLVTFCGAVSVLSTPAPPNLIAELCAQSEAFVREVCDDLSPNVRVSARGIEFANEDFEDFVRLKGKSPGSEMITAAADLLFDTRHTSEYSAIHLFDLLAASGQGERIFSVLDESDSTKIISDAATRRQTDFRRLKTAVSTANADGDMVQAGKTILIGAEATRSESKVYDLMTQNIPLSAVFAETSMRQEVLRNPKNRGMHGPLLMHLAKEAALDPETLPISREYCRLAMAWLRERAELEEEHHDWEFSDQDLAELTFAFYKSRGWAGAVDFCERWTPDLLPISMLSRAASLVIKRDGVKVLQDSRGLTNPRLRWIVTVALQRAGAEVSKRSLQEDLDELIAFDLPSLQIPDNWYSTDESRSVSILRDLMFFIEICSKRSCTKRKITALIDKVWPATNDLLVGSNYNPCDVDLSVKSLLLQSRLRGRAFDIKAYQPEFGEDEDKEHRDRVEKAFSDIERFVPFYTTVDHWIADQTTPPLAELQAAAGVLKTDQWRDRDNYNLRTLKEIAIGRLVDCYSLCDLSANSVVDTIQEIFSETDYFGEKLIRTLEPMLCNLSSFDTVSEIVAKYAEIAAEYEGPASERANVLIRISELLEPSSRGDARVYFERAIEIVEELDVEARDQVFFLARAIKRFPHNTPESREFAAKVADIISHTYNVLEGAAELPFEEAVTALGNLSTPIALCAISRWSDDGVLSSEHSLERLVDQCLRSGQISPSVSAGLARINEDGPLSIIDSLTQSAMDFSGKEQAQLLELLSTNALTERDPSHAVSLVDKLEEFSKRNNQDSNALDNLVILRAFLLTLPKKSEKKANDGPRENMLPHPATTTKSFSFSSTTDPDAIRELMPENTFDDRSVLEALTEVVAPGQRAKYLGALHELATTADWPPNYIEEILDCLNRWKNAGVKDWANSNVANLLVDMAPWTFSFGWYEKNYFSKLADVADLDDSLRINAIIRAIGANSANLSSIAIFKYAVEFANALSSDEAVELYSWYLDRLKAAQKPPTNPNQVGSIRPEAIPSDINATIPNVLYRFLGDIDARIRWRTAHAVRSLVNYGGEQMVEGLLANREQLVPEEFCASGSPFHRLSADLWLSMALSRIAGEMPAFIATHATSVMDIATNGDPHVLIIAHIKRALELAAETQRLKGVDNSEIELLLTGGIGTIEIETSRPIAFGYEKPTGVRFRFDSMDVLPYWYESAALTLDAVSSDEFLRTADRWIVDKWGADSDTANWGNEPRQRRFGRDYTLSDKGHGAYPTLERYSVYLQWHAMFVAVGDLMSSYPLASYKDDDYHKLSGWLDRWDTTDRRTWLADLQSHKPLVARYWQTLEDSEDRWLEPPPIAEYLNELTVESADEFVLSSERNVKRVSYGTREASESIEVSCVLAPQETASSLVKALQATEFHWDYYLPTESDNYEEDQERFTAFTMSPVIKRPRSGQDPGFDKTDPITKGIHWVAAAPSNLLADALKLDEGSSADLTPWATKNENRIVKYRSWNELNDSTSDQEMRSISGTFSNGYVLTARRQELLSALETLGMNLVVSVKVIRKTGDEYGYRKEEAKESIFDKIFLLRANGILEDIDGRVGAWR